MKPSVLILAGGKSSRMNGNNKAYLPMQESTFLAHLVQEFLKEYPVLISTNVEASYEEFQVRKIIDEQVSIGPMSGILSAFHQNEAEVIFVTACDMPWMNCSIVSRMSELLEDYDGVVLKEGAALHPLGALYCKNIVAKLEDGLYNKEYSLARCLVKSNVRYVTLEELGCISQCYENVNTQQDYQRLFDN